MSETEIMRIQTNLQIVTVLFGIFFLLLYIAFHTRSSQKAVSR